MSEIVYLGLGSNLGDRDKNLCRAANHLRQLEGLEILAVSSVYVSPAINMPVDSPSFLNMAIKGRFEYTPLELLTDIRIIEEKLGRTTIEKGRYLPRPIDIDMLLFGERIIDLEGLAVPHPELTKRPFVLIPLLDLEPDLVHPVTRKRMDTYLRDTDHDEVILYRELEAGDVNTKLYCP